MWADRPDRITLYALASSPLFWHTPDGPLLPHLRVVHSFPACFRTLRVDRGAIRFVLAGAALMAPGLTSKGGWLPPEGEEWNEGSVVAVGAEGKEEVCMVGRLKMGTDEVRKVGKGMVLDEGHYLGDGLWGLEVGG